MLINEGLLTDQKNKLYLGDCEDILRSIPDDSIDMIITSPPYCIGKAYENPEDDIETFEQRHRKIFKDIYRIVKTGGSICWQVGYHVINSQTIPLDYYVYQVFSQESAKCSNPLILRNRIIWSFGHGLNNSKRFSGRHEVILWFTKGHNYDFYLDAVRIPQKYPGKKAYKGKNKGEFSCNPLGKNPSDVWEIPNVKSKHVEKTNHPCQFPVAIPQRLIKALSPIEGVICDPYMGSGTTGVAAVLENRRFIGIEINHDYFQIAKNRIDQAINGEIRVREDIPICEPNTNHAVARAPKQFSSKGSANGDC